MAKGFGIALVVFIVATPIVQDVLYAIAYDFWKWLCALARRFRHARRPRRRRRVKRQPIRSTKADAKRRAHAYACQVAGRNISWKKARKLLARLEREGRARDSATAVVADDLTVNAVRPVELHA